MRSPAPERFSPAFSVVDFWESGVTVRLLACCSQKMRATKLTLLGSLLAESLAEVVRHVDLCGGLFGLEVVVVVVVDWSLRVGCDERRRKTDEKQCYIPHSFSRGRLPSVTCLRHAYVICRVAAAAKVSDDYASIQPLLLALHMFGCQGLHYQCWVTNSTAAAVSSHDW
jgi:hypothetical protein